MMNRSHDLGHTLILEKNALSKKYVNFVRKIVLHIEWI